MKAVKRFVKSDGFQRALAWAAAQYMKLAYLTTRWTIVSPPAFDAIRRAGEPFILCFWHNRLMIVRPGLPRQARVHMLISGHRDGLLISRAIAHFGVETIAGSTSRGGLGALREMQRLLRAGGIVGITPDGPRGPRMRAKPGAIKAAQLSGAPLVPLTCAFSRRRVLGTWDRFCFAKPFGRALIIWGEPIYVPRDADATEQERLRQKLEDELNAITQEADRRLGLPAIAPAPAESVEREQHAGA